MRETQDWEAVVEDAASVVELVDRYENGTLNSEELSSLVNLEDLASNFYRLPPWLHGQERAYQIRMVCVCVCVLYMFASLVAWQCAA